MKKFYTAADVNFYASKGESVIYIQPEDVVTSVAREEAEKKGIQFSISGIVEPAAFTTIRMSAGQLLCESKRSAV